MGIRSGTNARSDVAFRLPRRRYTVVVTNDRWLGLDRMDALVWTGPWRQGRLRRRVAVETLDAMVPSKILSSMRSRPLPRPDVSSMFPNAVLDASVHTRG